MKTILHILVLIFAVQAVFPTFVSAEESVTKPVSKKEPAAKAKKQKLPADFELDEKAYASMMDFLSALALVKMAYVDGEKATYEQLFKAALRGMLHELDPFSTYESAEVYRETQEETKGEMAGIGVAIVYKNNALEVMEVQEKGPAAKAGLRPGDLIMEINGESLNGKTMQECLKQLRGDAGTQVDLQIYRSSDDSTKNYTVTRGILTLPSVTGAKIADPISGTGYLRITQFGKKTPSEIDQTLRKLNGQEMKQLIIDLRNNPGGLVVSAVEVCSRFLREKQLVVSLEGRLEGKNTKYFTKKCESYPELPIAILVNENTASAAEIMTACLQDTKRAVVIGEKTFGKGVVQTLVPFGKDEALRITTSRYYTPLHRAIHGNGIEPEIRVPLTMARRFAIASQMNTHPGVVLPSAPNAVRDTQLERALEVLKAVRRFQDIHSKNK